MKSGLDLSCGASCRCSQAKLKNKVISDVFVFAFPVHILSEKSFFFQATVNASAAGGEDAINPDEEVQLFNA